jgi:hypothetical protein
MRRSLAFFIYACLQHFSTIESSFFSPQFLAVQIAGVVKKGFFETYTGDSPSGNNSKMKQTSGNVAPLYGYKQMQACFALSSLALWLTIL